MTCARGTRSRHVAIVAVIRTGPSEGPDYNPFGAVGGCEDGAVHIQCAVQRAVALVLLGDALMQKDALAQRWQVNGTSCGREVGPSQAAEHFGGPARRVFGEGSRHELARGYLT